MLKFSQACPTERIRNISVIAHVDHGKTSLTDYLLATNNVIPLCSAGNLRMMDFRTAEQDRGMTMKSSCISLCLRQDESNYLVNLMDTPGHIDFFSDVESIIWVSDGALLLVDAVEGVRAQTSCVLNQASYQKIPLILVINKIDLLIKELKLSPAEAEIHLATIIGDCNQALLNTSHRVEEFCPLKGNVIFCSASYHFGFDLRSFGNLYGQKLKGDPVEVSEKLWGNYVLKKSGEFVRDDKAETGAFAQLCLDTLWKIFKAFETDDTQEIQKFHGFLGRTPKDPSLRGFLHELLPLNEVLSKVLCGLDPVKLTRYPVDQLLFLGKRVAFFKQSLTLVSDTSSDEDVLVGVLVKCVQGSLKVGDLLYPPEASAETEPLKVLRIFRVMGRSLLEVPECQNGNIGLIELDLLPDVDYLCAPPACLDIPPIPKKRPVLSVFLDPMNLTDNDQFLHGLKLLKAIDPSCEISQISDGHYGLLICGQNHLDRCVADLQVLAKDSPFRVSEPEVTIRETVVSRQQCSEDFEKNEIDNEDPDFLIVHEFDEQPPIKVKCRPYQSHLTNILCETLEEHPNVLTHSPDLVLKDDQITHLVHGFRLCIQDGPLCGEPVSGVWFHLVYLESSENLVAEMKKACKQGMLWKSIGRIKEPLLSLRFVCGQTQVGRIYQVINTKKGNVISEECNDSLIFEIVATAPVADCQDLHNELRSITSGNATVESAFSHFGLVDESPFFDYSENRARLLINKVRKRKGLLVEDVNFDPRKQRTRQRKR